MRARIVWLWGLDVMWCTVVRSSAWSGVVQVPAVIFGSDASLRVGGWLVAGTLGDSWPDKSIRIIGGVILFRSGDCFASSITGGLQGGGGLVSRGGGVSGSDLSVRTTCGISGMLVPTVGGGFEGAGGLASVGGVSGDGPGQG